MKSINEALTFNDVLLIPKRSSIYSRKDVSTRTQFSRSITLNTPIVSANMDTVTEARMARFMAEIGGLGVIHRFLSIERQAEEVGIVKRAENVIIEDPLAVSPSMPIYEIEKIMQAQGISGMPVIDGTRVVIGIITRRDILFAEKKTGVVKDIMTKKVITAPRRISLLQAKKILFSHRVEKLPLVDKKGVLQGLITLKDIMRQEMPSIASKDRRGRFLVGAAVGVKEETIDRTRALLEAGADVIVLDIAHGHNKRASDTIRILKKKFPGVEIVGGNIATAEGAEDLIHAGADAIKIGVGPGAACTTRIVTGVGVPQLTAIIHASAVCKKYKIPCIGDGGIQASGDFAKAIAAGADTVMIGSLLAGCDEAPGEYIIEDGVGYKLYRGMASRDAGESKIQLDGSFADGHFRAPEGKSGKVPYRGNGKTLINDLVAGLRSSMSYLGARTIQELQKNAEFVRITQAGLKESHSHDMRT
jgi:IMP dehydrogenase